jgi:S-layer protein (TIGR01564 family)
MVGATILGAMAAADLSTYPKPFVDNGAFNALIVVGAAAKTEDVLGAIDIATSLQYANAIVKAVPGATASASVTGEGAEVATANNKLVIGDALADVKDEFDETELPTLLAKGTYVNNGDELSDTFDYTQKIVLGADPNRDLL